MFKIDLGVEVLEAISGLKGIVVGRIDYLTGCKQYNVKPKGLTKDGQMKEAIWIDEDRLKVISKGINIKVKSPGGVYLEGYPK